MTVCVLGAGAVGGALAARLAQAGHPVSVVARGDHGRAIEQHGICLIAGENRTTTRVPCFASIEEVPGKPSIVIVTVKQTQLPPLAKPLASVIRQGAVVVLAMNGVPWWFANELPLPRASAVMDQIDPGGSLSSLIPTDRLINAVVQSSCEVIEPGVIVNTTPGRNRLRIGWVAEPKPGEYFDRLSVLQTVLPSAGYETLLSENVRRDIWNKMSLWVAVSPLSALLGLPLNVLASDADAVSLMEGTMWDMVNLGRELGYDDDDRVGEKIAFYRDKPTRPSILKDIELGRAPELAHCILIFDEIAKAIGANTPFLSTIACMARLKFGSLVSKAIGPSSS